ncbi:MAG: ATP-binding protein [Lachnospiraceae bacterium]|nr:ATP-binding protein [Lachnospiraceae bacterium]
MFALVLVLSAVSFLIIGFLIKGSLNVWEADWANEQIREYMKSVEELCVGMDARRESVRKYYHDLSKHIRILETMMERQKDDEDAGEHVAGMENAIEPTAVQTETGGVMDAILFAKKEQCRRLHIPFDIRLEEPELADGRIEKDVSETDTSGRIGKDVSETDTSGRIGKDVSETDTSGRIGKDASGADTAWDVDMAALLLNLLDNAIEAQEQILDETSQGVWFSTGHRKDSLWIEVKNKVRKGKRITFQSEKPVPAEHGIGLRIIDTVIEKYHGTREVSFDAECCLLRKRVTIPKGEMRTWSS